MTSPLFHDVDSYSWVGPDTLKGSGGFMKVKDGVEIWASGEPDREYQPLKIVEATTSGTWEGAVRSYLEKVLRNETKKAGGDGFILLKKDYRSGGSMTFGQTNVTGTASLYGNNAYYNATGTTTATAVPIRYNTYQALVFKYK